MSGKYSSLYLGVPGPRGLESGQLFTGGGVGLVIRTNANNGGTGPSFPIRLAPNNAETLVLNPDKSAIFYGNVSVLGTASLNNLSLLNASIDTSQAARFRSGVTVEGNVSFNRNLSDPFPAPTTFTINTNSLQCSAASLFTNEVRMTNVFTQVGNPYLRIKFPQVTIPLRAAPIAFAVLPFTTSNVTHSRGIIATSSWVDAANKAIRIPYSGLYSISVQLFYDTASVRTFANHVHLERFTQAPSIVSWGIDSSTTIKYTYNWRSSTTQNTITDLTTEALLNVGDFVCVMLRSDHQEGTHRTVGDTGNEDQSHMTIRFIG